VVGNGYAVVVNSSGIYTISTSGLQPSGNYSLVGHSHSSSDISDFNSSVSGLVNGIYAPLNSPSLTGVPTAPTASSGTSNNQIANTQFVRNEISNLVNSAPSTLDTLNELATALGNDPNFATTISNSLGQKANLSGASFSGTVTAPSGNFSVLQQNGISVSVSGHTHVSENIIDFNSSVSGLLPLHSLQAGSGIQINNSNKQFNISATGLALSNHQHSYTDITNFASGIDQTVSTLLVAGSYINVNYDAVADTLTINATGLQPSGNYSVVGHSHTSSNITDFNSSVSGLLPVKNVVGSGYIGVSSSNGNYTVFATGLQPSGNYSTVGHSHVSSDITNFNSSVSGLLPVTNITGGTNINVVPSGTSFTVSATGLQPSGNYANVIHSHAIGDVTGLQTALDSKASTNHTHDDRYYTESEVDNLLSFKQPSGNYSLAGHSHASSDITNFNSAVSGLLPVTNIIGGTNISVISSGTAYTVSVSGQLGLTGEEVEDRVAGLLVAGTGIDLTYNDSNNTLVITSVGSSPSGNYALAGHTHTSSNITDFGSSVSGLLPVTNILGGTNISVVPSGTSYTVSVSGQLGLTAEEVDDRVSNLLVGGSGISIDYNDNSNTLTINNTSISPDEIEEYSATTSFPASGNLNILYVATDTGQIFKWDGEVYYEAGPQGASTATHGTQHETDGSDPIPLTEYNVPQFTSNTNNLNHLNKDILYITADVNNRELTGLLAPTFCCVKLLVNISSTNTIIIDHQSTNSDPANRFLNYTGSDYYLLPGQSLSVLYSTEAMRWRIL
jgi:hypothetical protein